MPSHYLTSMWRTNKSYYSYPGCIVSRAFETTFPFYYHYHYYIFIYIYVNIFCLKIIRLKHTYTYTCIYTHRCRRKCCRKPLVFKSIYKENSQANIYTHTHTHTHIYIYIYRKIGLFCNKSYNLFLLLVWKF